MSDKPIPVDRVPCSSCPYRVDTPPGVWHPDEYAKLAEFDEPHHVGVFLCHHTPLTGRELLCRGWLSVHADSIGVRFGVSTGMIDPADIDAPVDVELYESGTEACAAGMSGVAHPSAPARRMMDRLARRRDRVR